MPNQPVGYSGSISPCPFDGYATPVLIQSGTYVDGTSLYTVQCPICNVSIANQTSKQAAVDTWNLRIANTHTFVNWFISLNSEEDSLGTYAAWKAAYDTEIASIETYATWQAAYNAQVSTIGTYADWLAAYNAEVATTPTVSALIAWIAAHPPPDVLTAMSAWVTANPPPDVLTEITNWMTANPPPNIDALVTWIQVNRPVTD